MYFLELRKHSVSRNLVLFSVWVDHFVTTRTNLDEHCGKDIASSVAKRVPLIMIL